MHRHSSPYLFVEVNLNVGQAERTRWSPCRHRACGNYSRVVALTFNFNLSISIASKGCFPAPGNAVASTPTSRSIAHPRRCRCRERKKNTLFPGFAISWPRPLLSELPRDVHNSIWKQQRKTQAWQANDKAQDPGKMEF